MSEILSPSRLLPVTILVTTVTLSIKVFALVTAVPSLSDWRTGAAQALELASTARMIDQAYAAPNQAAEIASPSLPQLAPSVSAAPAMPAMPTGMPAGLPTGLPSAFPTELAPAPVPAPAPQALAAPQTLAPVEGDAGQPLKLRRGQLEEREQLLTEREATLAAADKHLTERVGELQAIQTRLETLESGRKAQEEANWVGLVKLYEGMRPRDAAGIFNALDKPVLLEIVDRMKAAKAAAVLALMEPESARQITAELAAKRTRTTTVSN
jgi:flagellar motility protein MotE (MotC chaperone)